MPRRAVNLGLLVAVPALAATGLLAWIAPEPLTPALLIAHRIAGVALVLALAWKYGIARRSLRRRSAGRRDLSLVLSAVSSTALLIVLGLGLLWTSGVVSFDRPIVYSTLNVHVLVGIALVPLVIAHAAQRWERRPAISDIANRRVALRVFGLGAGALVVTMLLDRIGADRRITGSRHAGSFSGNAFPLTIWRFDEVPSVAVESWRLSLHGLLSAPGELRYADLLALPATERAAVIDCTGGWWSEQLWRGVPLAELLRARGLPPRARRIEVTSLTGHAASFAVSDAGDLLLATHVGGEVLAYGHGFPVRLVAPGRRGFEWVKWVARVDVA